MTHSCISLCAYKFCCDLPVKEIVFISALYYCGTEVVLMYISRIVIYDSVVLHVYAHV